MFIPNFNEKFSHPPRESQSSFGQIKYSNLDLIFCRKEARKVAAGNTFSYGGKKINQRTSYEGSFGFLLNWPLRQVYRITPSVFVSDSLSSLPFSTTLFLSSLLILAVPSVGHSCSPKDDALWTPINFSQ